MKMKRAIGGAGRFEFTVELESIYSRDREWRISKCYQEVIGVGLGSWRVLLRNQKENKYGSFKVSKKA